MNLPEWLYETLPYAYAASGALTLMAFENLPGNLAGGTLVAAGVITWLMRQRHRRAKRLRPARATAVRTNIVKSTAGSYYNDPG